MTKTDWENAIAGNIRAERHRARLSQQDVASQMRTLGFTAWLRSTVSVAENGARQVTAPEIIALADIFGVAVPVLMKVSDP